MQPTAGARKARLLEVHTGRLSKDLAQGAARPSRGSKQRISYVTSSKIRFLGTCAESGRARSANSGPTSTVTARSPPNNVCLRHG
jgi:hypothetical protein